MGNCKGDGDGTSLQPSATFTGTVLVNLQSRIGWWIFPPAASAPPLEKPLENPCWNRSPTVGAWP